MDLLSTMGEKGQYANIETNLKEPTKVANKEIISHLVLYTLDIIAVTQEK